ncbi:MAG: cytochrome ubiquinol oxidase subunit I [Legionellales bacterium]|nr:cytochrome ubiquinol oxidase subunit I [Legionellales bacterium]|tara:strand:+ start:1256 stop:2629 length:1374 start_codon:yes stop_codon:yes gene_type:complete
MIDDLTLLLSRIQFAISIGFHGIYPTLNIGMACFILIMESLWVKTNDIVYLQICQFWNKIFALTFGVGVVSGIVLAYQLGTNFGPFIAYAGEVIGPLFANETLTAFFLEAGFLGIMLFGWKRVGRSLHLFSTAMVCFGTILSAFWIMSANSWMQTPVSYTLDVDHLVPISYAEIIFNPSFLTRFTHMLFSAWLTACFFILGISCYYIHQGIATDKAKLTLKFSLIAALILAPMQLMVGDAVGLIVHQYQPMKTAAMEANWRTQSGVPLVLFALPDQTNQVNHYEISIPKLASFINTHDWDGELEGLDQVAIADQPNVFVIFWTFRIMVGLGLCFIAVPVLGLCLGRRIYNKHWFQWIGMLMTPMGLVATTCGWMTAEVGRQPWIIYNVMRTRDGASLIPVESVTVSLTVLVIVYSIVLSCYMYYLFKVIQTGPMDLDNLKHTVGYLLNKPVVEDPNL